LSGTAARLSDKPLAGLLLGGLAGGLGGYALEQLRDEEEENRRPWQRALTGALAGGALGGGLGAVAQFRPSWFGLEDRRAKLEELAKEQGKKGAPGDDPLRYGAEKAKGILGAVGGHEATLGAGAGLLTYSGLSRMMGVSPQNLPTVAPAQAVEAFREGLSQSAIQMDEGTRAALSEMADDDILRGLRQGFGRNPADLMVDVPERGNVAAAQKRVTPSTLLQILEHGAEQLRARPSSGAGIRPLTTHQFGLGPVGFLQRLFQRPATARLTAGAGRSGRGMGRLALLLAALGGGAYGGLQYGKDPGVAAARQSEIDLLQRAAQAGR
jgi:hypothetical protein